VGSFTCSSEPGYYLSNKMKKTLRDAHEETKKKVEQGDRRG
jgi:hypothetical protein